MADDKPMLTRRRVLGGIATVGAAGAVGAGTWAEFSDKEVSTNNFVKAGTLDLLVDGENKPVTTVDVSNVAPGDSGSGTNKLKNNGSLDGYLNFKIGNVVNADNSHTEPELAAGDNRGSGGELAQNLDVTVTIGSNQVFDGKASKLMANHKYDVNESLTSGEEKDFTVDYSVPSDVGNIIQSDSLKVGVAFLLDQNKQQ